MKNKQIIIIKNTTGLTMLFCQLFFCLFIFNSCSKKPLSDKEYYSNYIAEDQGMESGDTSLITKIYPVEITGDTFVDYIYIATFMDNYFGYVFNGETREEIPQTGWVNFISKPGREMQLIFQDLNCDSINEIIKYSVTGQNNEQVRLDILSYQNGYLNNIFLSHLIEYKNEDGKLIDIQFDKAIFPEKCNNTFTVIRKNGIIPRNQFDNKIEIILKDTTSNKKDFISKQVYEFNPELNKFTLQKK